MLTLLQGPPSADHDDGYTTSNYYKSLQQKDEKTLLRGDSGGALNELVEQEEVLHFTWLAALPLLFGTASAVGP